MRRDFATVLSLIRAHALLHRATRELVASVVIATLADHAAVRDLVTDLVSDAVEQTVSDAIRATVEKVAELTITGGEVTVVGVAARLGIARVSTEVGTVQRSRTRRAWHDPSLPAFGNVTGAYGPPWSA
jgi:hypothetical protein